MKKNKLTENCLHCARYIFPKEVVGMEKFLKIVFFVCCLAFAVLTMIGCVDDFEKEDQGTNNDEKKVLLKWKG